MIKFVRLSFSNCQILQEKMRFLFPFGPAPDYNVRGAFLRLPADDLARQAMHVPLLIGYNSREGLYLFGSNYDFLIS